MTREFVNYEQALALKELGFDEPCVYYVDKDNNSYIYNFQTHPDEFIEGCGVNVIPTPTFSQAFRFFREKHDLQSACIMFPNGKYGNAIVMSKATQFLETYMPIYDTYEEAELTCLDKLIEICKEKKS